MPAWALPQFASGTDLLNVVQNTGCAVKRYYRNPSTRNLEAGIGNVFEAERYLQKRN
jgi:hypothetical protein